MKLKTSKYYAIIFDVLQISDSSTTFHCLLVLYFKLILTP